MDHRKWTLFDSLCINRIWSHRRGRHGVSDREILARYWLTNTDVVLPELALTISKPHELRQLEMFLMQDAMCDQLAPLHASAGTDFQGNCGAAQKWCCFVILVSYCYKIPWAKDMSTVKLGVAMRPPCVSFPSTMDAVWNLRCGRPHNLTEVKLASSFISW